MPLTSQISVFNGGLISNPLIESSNGASAKPAMSLTGSWFTGGSATTTKPQLLIEASGATSTGWSTSGTGFGVNAASGFSGNLLDLQTNGTSLFRVRSDGAFIATNGGSISAELDVTYIVASNRCAMGNGIINGFSNNSTGFYAWAQSSSWFDAVDLALYRNAAGILEINNGTAGTFAALKLSNLTASGTIATGTPSGGAGAGVWKLGVSRTGTGLITSTTTVLQVDIGGTLYSLMTCTTNP